MSDIDAHYKNASAVLWVEDPETRAWLDGIWLGAAPSILVLVAGGHPSVKAACEQAKDAGHRHVFGLVDCDFGTSNRHRWPVLSPQERIYRLDVHEFENLLLDPAALAGCLLNTAKRVTADVEARLISAASSRSWWVACSRFLASTSVSATTGYPPNPRTVASLSDAATYVLNSPWFASTALTCASLASPLAVQSAIQAEHVSALAALTSGAWRVDFPGKEIFREVASYVNPNMKGTSGRVDIIKSIAAWQLVNGVPPQATELRQLILARI